MLKVNPTRINLLNLKRELKVAEKGFKLLKDKRDGLMKKFMEIVRETRELRGEVDESLPKFFKRFTISTGQVPENVLNSAFILPNAETHLEAESRSLMSVQIPVFELKTKGKAMSYGFLETSGEMDRSLKELEEVFPKIVKLAELETAVENLALEIERTRRRTSALENSRIPALKETIKFIHTRLEEQARDSVVSTMRIKAMIVAKEEN